ncbi:hypothetical protein XFF6992_220062 [Xanthomonas citri pv. fuscans]|nr:hypothetical protein XFF6992_220062 [Xanthomonas citri pv. fuscans]SOO31712.1 hypothetical protein XFF6994_1490013 [Xanthomonas citri pv. fuscans]
MEATMLRSRRAGLRVEARRGDDGRVFDGPVTGTCRWRISMQGRAVPMSGMCCTVWDDKKRRPAGRLRDTGCVLD